MSQISPTLPTYSLSLSDNNALPLFMYCSAQSTNLTCCLQVTFFFFMKGGEYAKCIHTMEGHMVIKDVTPK